MSVLIKIAGAGTAEGLEMEELGNYQYAARLQITFTTAINANLPASTSCKRPPSIRVSGPGAPEPFSPKHRHPVPYSYSIHATTPHSPHDADGNTPRASKSRRQRPSPSAKSAVAQHTLQLHARLYHIGNRRALRNAGGP